MGTLNFTVGDYGRNKGRGAATVRSTKVIKSDAFSTTEASPRNVEDGSGDITLAVGQIFMCVADEAMWINFGGTAATVGDGHYLLADVPYEFECDTAGTVSVIDVA